MIMLFFVRCKPGTVDDGTGRCVDPEEECGCYDPITGKTLYDGQVVRPDPRDKCREW